MNEMNQQDWDNIFELLEMGVSYDNDGCTTPAAAEADAHDASLMASYRKLKAIIKPD